MYLLWLLYFAFKQKLQLNTIVCALIFLIGSYFLLPTEHAEKSNKNILEEPILIKGKIDSQVYLKDSSLSFIVKQNDAVKVNVRYFYENDIQEVKDPLKTIETGRECILKGIHSPPPIKSNPGQFDYAQYLANQAIYSEIVVADLQDISCAKKSFLSPIWSLRNKLILKIKTNYNDLSSSWLIALILGEDSFIESDIIDLFRHWNIAHLLAISGLHTAIFVGIIYFILMKLLKLTIEKTQIILIIILPIFTILSGAEPSVIRASLMVISFIILNLLKIRLTPSDLLSLIFIILVILDPALLNHIGFQFSFAVTFSLLISLKWLNQTNNRLIQSFKISFISQMIILPLQLHYFAVFQPLSIILNVFVIPYFTLFVIPYMFVMLLALMLPEILRSLLDVFFTWIHTIFLDSLKKLDLLFSDHFLIGDLQVNQFIIYYVILFMFMWAIEKIKIPRATVIGVVFVVFIFFLNLKESFSPEGRVTMLDIGQGDAIMIELPHRNGVFMMDVGSSFSFKEQEPSKKVYEQIIKPYLYYRGIDSIDGIFLSHDHLDHTGSLEFMLDEFNIKEVFVSPYHPIEGDLLAALKKSKTKITIINPPEKLVRNGLSFQILHPVKDQFDENDNSLIVYTEIGGKSWLFNGDASTHNELEVLNTFPNLKADFLKVGHHGSNTSTDEVFLQNIMPKYGLVSAGANNSYGHPTLEVIERLENHDIEIYRTDEDGAIEYNYNLKTKKASLSKYIK